VRHSYCPVPATRNQRLVADPDTTDPNGPEILINSSCNISKLVSAEHNALNILVLTHARLQNFQ
jgi:hypothetical protein